MEATVAERGQITCPRAVMLLGLTKGTLLKVELDGAASSRARVLTMPFHGRAALDGFESSDAAVRAVRDEE